MQVWSIFLTGMIFYNPSLSSYRDCSALTGWDNRSDFFSLWRIFGSFASKKIFPGTERVKLILSGGENQKWIQERNRYIQLCRENEHSAFYMTQQKRNYCDMKKESKFSFS